MSPSRRPIGREAPCPSSSTWPPGCPPWPPPAAEEMGRGARERQRREFDLEALVGRLERLYSELLATPASGGPRRRAARATLASLRSAQARAPADCAGMGVATENFATRDVPEPGTERHGL